MRQNKSYLPKLKPVFRWAVHPCVTTIEWSPWVGKKRNCRIKKRINNWVMDERYWERKETTGYCCRLHCLELRKFQVDWLPQIERRIELIYTALWLVENRSRGMNAGLWLDNTAAYTFTQGSTIICLTVGTHPNVPCSCSICTCQTSLPFCSRIFADVCRRQNSYKSDHAGSDFRNPCLYIDRYVIAHTVSSIQE